MCKSKDSGAPLSVVRGDCQGRRRLSGIREPRRLPDLEESEMNIQTDKWPEPLTEQPTVQELQEWYEEGGCESTAGQWIEPDGVDAEGYPSWLLYLGLI